MRLKWTIVILVVCVPVAAAAVGYALGRAGVPVHDVVRAKRFELVDDKRRVRVLLGPTSEQHGMLLFLDVEGTARGGLSPGAEGKPGLFLTDKSGKSGATMYCDSSGGHLMVIKDSVPIWQAPAREE